MFYELSWIAEPGRWSEEDLGLEISSMPNEPINGGDDRLLRRLLCHCVLAFGGTRPRQSRLLSLHAGAVGTTTSEIVNCDANESWKVSYKPDCNVPRSY